MKKWFALLPLCMSLAASPVCADEPKREGVHSDVRFQFRPAKITRLPATSTFQKQDLRLAFPFDVEVFSVEGEPGESIYILNKRYGPDTSLHVVSIVMRIRKNGNPDLYRKGPLRLQEATAMVALREFVLNPEFRLSPPEPKYLDISGRKAVSVSVLFKTPKIYADHGFPIREYKAVIYCAADSDRVFDFRVASLSDAPQDLIDAFIKAVESASLLPSPATR